MDPMDRLPFDLLRDELRQGFDGMHKRLDTLNGQVRLHGDQIAHLEARTQITEDNATRLMDLSENFAAHRAQCPFDAGARNSHTLAFTLDRRKLALIGAILSAIGALVIDLVYRYATSHRS